MAKYEQLRKCPRCHRMTKNYNLCDACSIGGFSDASMKSAEKGFMLDQRRGDVQDKIDPFIRDLEQSIDILFEERHSYPMWPTHNVRLNDFEEMYHGFIRQMYYERIRSQIRLLRRLRTL